MSNTYSARPPQKRPTGQLRQRPRGAAPPRRPMPSGGQVPGYQPGMVRPPMPQPGMVRPPMPQPGYGMAQPQINPQMLQAMMQLLQNWGGGGGMGGAGMYR